MLTRFVPAALLCLFAGALPSACGTPALAQDEDPEGVEGVGEMRIQGPGSDAAQDVRETWLRERLSDLLSHRADLGEATIGLVVHEARTGRVIAAENADELSHVASNTKILTTAAVLARLGPEFRYRTSVLAEKIDGSGVITGDLYLRGRGDPVLDAARLGTLADDLERAGVVEVRGRLIADDSYFSGRITPPAFDDFEEPLDRHAAFRAPVAALTVDRGAFTVIVTAARSGDGPARVNIEPPSDYVQIAENRVLTQSEGRPRINLSLGSENGRTQVHVSGQVQPGSWPRRFRLRVEDPALHAGYVLRKALSRRGIRVRGEVERGVTPPAAHVLGTTVSPPLAVIVRSLGKRSDNAVAEALLATLGAERVAAAAGRTATWDDGVSALRSFLIDDLGFAGDGFRVVNGSGLFGDTRVSPTHLARVLERAYAEPRWGPDFIASLAIAGVDGTMRRRLRWSPARGLVRAKTGTLGTVSALSGYASVPAGETLVFSIVMSGLPKTGAAKQRGRRAARLMQNRIAEALVQYLGGDLPGVTAPEPETGEPAEPDSAQP